MNFMTDAWNEALKKAIWKNHGACYNRALFENEEDAKAFSKLVKEDGDTVNGGWYHGRLLGDISKVPNGWEVMY